MQASGSFGSFVLTSFYPYIHNHNSLVFALIFVSDVVKYKGQWYSNDNSYVNMLQDFPHPPHPPSEYSLQLGYE